MHEHLLLALNAPAQLPLCTTTLLPASTTVGPLFLFLPVLPHPPRSRSRSRTPPRRQRRRPTQWDVLPEGGVVPNLAAVPPSQVGHGRTSAPRTAPTVVAMLLATHCHMRKVAKQVVRTDDVVTPEQGRSCA